VHPALAVRADRQRLAQVLVNLMSNAVKYSPRGSAVTVSCTRQSDGRASVVIADTGAGMSRDDLERIFVPFERLGAERTDVEGTGIGLPLARALTEAMGGQLTAASSPGRGSAFTVSMPVAPDVTGSAAPETTQEPRLHPHVGHGGHAGAAISVLYIEDNPTNVEVVSRFLKGRQNITLRTAGSGRAGIEAAMADTPDVILLDLHLPDLHGEQVLRELRAEPSIAGVPVVVLSAEASPRMIRRLRAAGALAYLTKPLVLAELGELLDSVAAAAHKTPA